MNNPKEIAKNIINSFPKYSVQSLIRKISVYQYVSFDIFDTLIKRNVPEPKDIFLATAQRFCEAEGCQLDPNVFQADRMEAERIARLKVVQTGKEDVTLSEIYSQLPDCYETIRWDLMSAEIETEKNCCHANPVVSKVFHWCREHGKQIILISDMYLPQGMIEDILRKCGYSGYKRLYLSSAVGKTKHTGALYDYVLADLSISPKQMVHIGDSLRGDWLNARKRRIQAVRIARNPKRTKFTRLHKMPEEARRQFAPLASVMNGYIDPEWDDYYQFGFECLGPLLYGFCTWLHEDVKSKGLERIFFFSRDGYLMQKGYQLLYGEKAVPNTYLYVSRRALYTPQIWIHPEFENILSLYGHTDVFYDCDTFCDKLGVNIEVGRSAWQECKLGDQLYIKKYNPKFEIFYEAVKDNVILHSKETYGLLVEYLQQNYFEGNVAVVDIGWAGSMQLCLEDIISHSKLKTTMYGYYIGLKEGSPVNKSASSYIQPRLKPQIGITGLWEMFFCSRQGSTRSYYRSEPGSVEPDLYPKEPRSDEEYERIARIQQGALTFIQDTKNALNLLPESSEVTAVNLLNAGRNPRKIEISMFADLSFFDIKISPLAQPRGIIDYLKKPEYLRVDFADSYWKVGFMKRLFRLPLPYWGLFKVLRRRIKSSEG